jgi:hypothetical protein
MIAARFSAINSLNAALHLTERSAGESHESVLDDRRERAHPPDDKQEKLPTINIKIIEHIDNERLRLIF